MELTICHIYYAFNALNSLHVFMFCLLACVESGCFVSASSMLFCFVNIFILFSNENIFFSLCIVLLSFFCIGDGSNSLYRTFVSKDTFLVGDLNNGKTEHILS